MVVLESAGVTESLWASALKCRLGILVEEKIFSWFTLSTFGYLLTVYIAYLLGIYSLESRECPLSTMNLTLCMGVISLLLTCWPMSMSPILYLEPHHSAWRRVDSRQVLGGLLAEDWISLAEMFLVVRPLGVLFLEFSSQADGWEAFSKPFHGFLYQETNLS